MSIAGREREVAEHPASYQVGKMIRVKLRSSDDATVPLTTPLGTWIVFPANQEDLPGWCRAHSSDHKFRRPKREQTLRSSPAAEAQCLFRNNADPTNLSGMLSPRQAHEQLPLHRRDLLLRAASRSIEP